MFHEKRNGLTLIVNLYDVLNTLRLMVFLTTPASFCTVQVYCPSFFLVTDFITNTLDCSFKLTPRLL